MESPIVPEKDIGVEIIVSNTIGWLTRCANELANRLLPKSSVSISVNSSFSSSHFPDCQSGHIVHCSGCHPVVLRPLARH